MPMLSPLYTLTLPLIFLCSIPIACFACLTTALAFSILFFRVTLIYIDLAAAIMPQYLLGATRILAHPPTVRQIKSASPTPPPSARRRKRRTSSSSAHSATGSITPMNLSSHNSILGLSASVGPSRDYEGVGGWRLDNPSGEDDALWTKTNSRLELPADHVRRHKRSLTSGCVPHKGEVGRGRKDGDDMVVMNTGRARTPPTSGMATNATGGTLPGYFTPQEQNSVKSSKRTPSLGTISSGSSKSSGLSMKQR
ncbi:hypothetical protein G7Y89_g2210 [Cudoniella acicularis]|uniref:Uncharacterized protein n=1 Tax=Cudoniella acicularis TaxID=354080 RepID=A0A8H4RTS0_9HELO|nr:hypothetical protein G7Y89_g2210 [Cudoniella acicularis]